MRPGSVAGAGPGEQLGEAGGPDAPHRGGLQPAGRTGGREEQISEQTFPAGGITPCCRPSPPPGWGTILPRCMVNTGHAGIPAAGRTGGAQTSPPTLTVPRRCTPAGCCGQRARLSGCSQAGAEPRCYTGRSQTFSRGARRQPCPLGRQQRGRGVRQHPHQCPPTPVLQSHRPGLPAQRPVPLARHRRCGRRALPPSLCSALPAAGTSLLAPPPAPAPRWGEACGHAGLSVAGCRQQQSWSKGSASIPLALAHLSQGRWSGESPVPRAGCWEKGPPAAWDSRKPPKCVWGSGRAGSPRAATELPAPRDLAARVGAELCCLLPAARRRRCWRASGGRASQGPRWRSCHPVCACLARRQKGRGVWGLLGRGLGRREAFPGRMGLQIAPQLLGADLEVLLPVARSEWAMCVQLARAASCGRVISTN